MPKHMVKCRVCKQTFDAQPEGEDIDWVMPSRNWYFHKPCYEEWKVATVHTDDDWMLMIYDLIARDLKVSYNFSQIEAQRKKFISQQMTNKGIYYSLFWFYFIKKGNVWKEDYGIGIVPYIYKDATEYWTSQVVKTNMLIEQIEDIARERISKEPVKYIPRTRRKTEIKAPD